MRLAHRHFRLIEAKIYIQGYKNNINYTINILLNVSPVTDITRFQKFSQGRQNRNTLVFAVTSVTW